MSLLAAAYPDRHFANSLEPTNPAFRPQFERWKSFSRELQLPVTFGLGHQVDCSFPKMVACSEAIVTTSVAEGFGLGFLEPWVFGKSLCGRNLPEITGDFTGTVTEDWEAQAAGNVTAMGNLFISDVDSNNTLEGPTSAPELLPSSQSSFSTTESKNPPAHRKLPMILWSGTIASTSEDWMKASRRSSSLPQRVRAKYANRFAAKPRSKGWIPRSSKKMPAPYAKGFPFPHTGRSWPEFTKTC